MSKDFYFSAGEMTIKDKKVQANKDHGVLRFYMNSETQLLSMKWENLDKKASNEEIIITPGDWIYKKISTSKGCPFCIQNTSYPDDQYFFYFQTKNKENIEKIEKTLEDILKTGELPKKESTEEKSNVPMSIEEMQKSQQNATANQFFKNIIMLIFVFIIINYYNFYLYPNYGLKIYFQWIEINLQFLLQLLPIQF